MTSFLTLPLFHQDFYFTPWGIISGLFWVPAGVAAIYAVQNAGLAVSQGIWSSLIVIVSFVWGIAFFDEQVRSEGMAIISIFFMIVGLCGMSYFSSPDETDANRDEIEERARSVCSSVMDEGTGIDADSNTDADSDGNEDGNLTGLEYKGLASEDEFHNEEPSQRNSHHDIIRRRRLGIAAAIFNGVWGGSILVRKSQFLLFRITLHRIVIN
jgi:multidrug transporter EmrE-like cation transporter